MSTSSLFRSPEAASADPGSDGEANPTQVRSKPRLLVVDDVADNRTVLARRFQRRDFETVEADGGIKALELVESGCFDAVLLDIMMPDLDGLEVLRKIRLDHSPESLPVIMVTAKNESADIVEALGLGANDYVVKPVDFSVALARVNVPFDANRTGRRQGHLEPNDCCLHVDCGQGDFCFSARCVPGEKSARKIIAGDPSRRRGSDRGSPPAIPRPRSQTAAKPCIRPFWMSAIHEQIAE